MRGSFDGICRWLALKLAAAPLLVAVPLLVAGCGIPADHAGQADEGTPIDVAMKLDAYDVSLIGIDLRDAQEAYRGQDIGRAKPDGEFFVGPERMKSWVEELDRAIAMDGTVPTVDPAARRFVEALRVLTIRLQSLDSYYRMRANLADKLARGRREDPLVLADYDRALAAIGPFRDAVTQAANAADATLAAKLRAEGRMVDYYNVQIARRARLLRVVADAPDALMISVTDSTAMKLPLAEAKAAGIDVITIDGDLEDKGIALTNIQSDNEEGGALAAENLAELVGGKGAVLGINQSPGNPIGEAREKGFKDKLAEYPGMTYLQTQYSENSTATAAQIASAAATSNADLVGVYTMSTNNTEGAITGVREAGKTGVVRVVGYDTSEPILQALRDGTVDGVVVQYPYGEGQTGVQSAVDASQGKDVPREQTAPFVFATPENQASEEVQRYVYKTDCA